MAIEAFGRIDVMVNNAGVSVVKPIHEHTPEEWDAVINTHIRKRYRNNGFATVAKDRKVIEAPACSAGWVAPVAGMDTLEVTGSTLLYRPFFHHTVGFPPRLFVHPN
jgi:NAD(P)-dependent dehydrogenase (short-subunit alcohol dehydrogenase family)